jgi:adenylate cyclase class IV
MIIGLIPIGGKGTRLGLPFSKEMLPQKDYGFYNPIANHLVEKMQLAGAEKIIFVHGDELKGDVKSFFNNPDYFAHIKQNSKGFAQVIKDASEQVPLNDSDEVLFGMPDSVFEGNPYIEMLTHGGICVGLFTTSINTKVDRLTSRGDLFEVKSIKKSTNSDLFWGVVKFDGLSIKKFIRDGVFDKTTEVGEVLNNYKFEQVLSGRYIDVGTWENYNKYLSRKTLYPSTEIEKKYIANEIDDAEFISRLKEIGSFNYEFVESTDFYFKAENKNVEFVRFREKSSGSILPADITVKNLNPDALNRYELELPLPIDVKTESVLSFLKLIGLDFKFKVFKKCHIFTSDQISIVLYSFPLLEKTVKIVEMELLVADFELIDFYEEKLNGIRGFNPDSSVNSSKFKLITEALRDAPQ